MSATRLEQALPRLLRGCTDGAMRDLDRHLALHGPLPDPRRLDAQTLLEAVEQADLRGRGGAAFPAARKLRAVRAARGRPIVVANGCESEPLSAKDAQLLAQAPHLVLDGAALAARVVGANEVVVALHEGSAGGRLSVERAIAQRTSPDRDAVAFRLASTAARFLAGQETAVVSQLNGGPAKPTFIPPRPTDHGVRRQPTLLQNVETLAHLALIARHGPRWYREIGTPAEPGSTLVTLVGAVARAGVYEIELGTPLRSLLAAAGGLDGAIGALLIGGYFGTWLPPELADDVELSHAGLRRVGAALGCGIVVMLPAYACPVAETVRVAIYLAHESARQCGPCVHGTAAIARALHAIAEGTAPAGVFAALDRWTSELPGRGACHHPDGLAHLAASALDTFADAFAQHARHGRCAACEAAPVLGVPTATVGARR